MNNLRAVGTKVLIKPDEVKDVLEGKIASIKVRKDSLLRGEIVNSGNQTRDEICDGKFCYYTAYGYEEVGDYVLVDQDDVFAIER